VRVAQGHAVEKDSKQQHTESEIILQTMATECLVSLLNSLLVWHKDGEPIAHEGGSAPAVDASPEESVHSKLISHVGSAVDLATESGDQSPRGEKAAGDKGTRKVESVESKKAYKLGFQEGIALFNTKPKKGIKFMQDNGMLGTSPKDIATFLAKTSGLNKTMIGDYLGEREETSLKVPICPYSAHVFTLWLF